MEEARNLFLSFIFLILLTASVGAETTLNIESGEWQIVSPPADEIDIGQLRDEGCKLEGGPWAWQSEDGEYRFAEKMNPVEGYWIKVSEGCSLTQDDSGSYPDAVQLTDGQWNMVSVPSVTSGISFEPYTSRCKMSEGGGGPWGYDNGYTYYEDLDPVRGYFIKAGADCEINLGLPDQQEEDRDISDGEPLVEDYLIMEAESNTREISRNQDLSVSLDISLNNSREDIGARPNIALLKNGERIKERKVEWGTSSLTFSHDLLWSGGDETDVDLTLVMDRNREGDYWWRRQEVVLGEHEIQRCGSDYLYNEFHEENGAGYDGCIRIKQDLLEARFDIEELTDWKLVTRNSVIHTLESIEGEEKVNGEQLLIDTGEEGFCGRAYFENKYSGIDGSFTVEADMKTLGDPNRLGFSQDPQTFFIQINGENATVQDLDHGESREFTHEVDQGDVVRMGILGDPDPPLFACGQWISRTAVEMDVEGDFDNYDSGGGLPGTVR